MADEINSNNLDHTLTFQNAKPGMVVSHYKIVDRIGSGGMGAVYLAEDTKLGRNVALKFLHPFLFDDIDARQRFQNEARAISSLVHGNIRTIFDIDQAGGQDFLVMEYIDGESLKDISCERKFTIEEIVDIAIQLCEGLKAAHAKGITHRDIKPANILLTAENQVKIADFGLAKQKGGDGLTMAGSILGTIRYMSPEQLRGEEADAQSDIFALGIVLFELTSGQLPFSGEIEAAVINSILNGTPKHLQTYRPDAPDKLSAIIDRCLDKNRSSRYQNCLDLHNDLQELKDEIRGITAGHGSRSQTPSYQKQSIGVLYFEDLSGDENLKWLSRGLPHMLITNLEQSKYVDVIGYQRLFDILHSIGNAGDAQITPAVATEVCRKAGVSIMVLGGIFKSQDKVRIDYTIQDVNSGKVIHAGKVLGKELFSLADRIGTRIREKLDIDPHVDARSVALSETANSTEAYRYYLEGLDYYYKLYWDNAVASFEKTLKLDANFAMAYYGLALIKLEKNSPEKEELIKKAVHLRQRVSTKERHYIMSLHAIIIGDYGQAVDELLKIINRYKNEKDALYWLGYINRTKLQHPDEAIKYFCQAIELDAQMRQAYNELVYAYDQTGNFEKSIWAADKYISFAPDEANPHDTKGDLYASNGKLDLAIESYRKALEIKPDFYLAMQKLGVMAIFKRDFTLAYDCFHGLSISNIKYRRAEGRTCLAWVPMYQGKFQESLSILNDGLVADKMEGVEDAHNANKHFFKANIFAEMKNWDYAVKEAGAGSEIWHRAYPNDPVYARHYLSQLLAMSGNYKSAEKLINDLGIDIEAAGPSYLPMLYYAKAAFEYTRGNLADAYDLIEPAMKSSLHFYVHYLYARICMDIGKLDLAATEFERQLKIFGNSRLAWAICSIKAHYYLAKIYMQSGWKGKAREQLHEFVSIWKDADYVSAETTEARACLFAE